MRITEITSNLRDIVQTDLLHASRIDPNESSNLFPQNTKKRSCSIVTEPIDNLLVLHE